MSNDVMSQSTDSSTEPSKSVTKVQKLPNVGIWNDVTALLRDYVKSYFSKRSAVLRLKKELPTRKRVVILTPEDVLLVYETNCTGYSFDIRSARKLNTSCLGSTAESFEKSCTVTLKYKFGSVILVLVNAQISVWRRTLSTIFEGECFDRSLVIDLSLYTARDDDDSFFATGSTLDESAITLKSAHGFTMLSPVERDLSLDETQQDVPTSKTNSNRSLTYLPSSLRSSLNSLTKRDKPPQDPTISSSFFSSIRRGSRCVSYLAKKFEAKLGSIGRKMTGDLKEEEEKKVASPPLEILFPPLPVQKVKEEEEDLEKSSRAQVSKLDFTPSKKARMVDRSMEIEQILIE